MKKKTIAIVSISLILALLAVSVIATFPTYLFEDNGSDGTSSIQSDKVTEGVQGDDVGELGGDGGAAGLLPEIDDNNVSGKGFIKYATADGIVVKGEKGAFPKDTAVEIDELGFFDKLYYRARHYVRDFADEYAIYNITAEKDGSSVSPDGNVRVIFTIPEDFDADEIEVYYMMENGVQKLNCKVDKKANTVTVTLVQPGVFIFIDKDTTVEDQGSSSEDTSSDDSSSEGSTSSDSSSDTSSDSSDTESGNTSSEDTSSEDPYQDTMSGWTPWY